MLLDNSKAPVADIFEKDSGGLNCLHWALLQHDAYLLELLLSHLDAAEFKWGRKENQKLLHLACIDGRDSSDGIDASQLQECVQILLSKTNIDLSEIDSQDSKGFCLLHYLASNWQNESIASLIDYGANIYLKDQEYSMSCLHFTASLSSLCRAPEGKAQEIIKGFGGLKEDKHEEDDNSLLGDGNISMFNTLYSTNDLINRSLGAGVETFKELLLVVLDRTKKIVWVVPLCQLLLMHIFLVLI